MSIGIWQVVLILLIVLILFGAGKLPKVMGDVAKGVKNFKSGLKEEDADEEEAARPREIEAGAAPRHAGETATALKRDEVAKG
jgi:sec-independent protein translocase protein TatA